MGTKPIAGIGKNHSVSTSQQSKKARVKPAHSTRHGTWEAWSGTYIAPSFTAVFLATRGIKKIQMANFACSTRLHLLLFSLKLLVVRRCQTRGAYLKSIPQTCTSVCRAFLGQLTIWMR